MPCNCDYMDANNLEVEISRVACLLDELAGKRKLDPSHWRGYHPRVYGNVTKLMGDELTAQLCEKLHTVDVTKYSLEMQIWWRDHQKADKKRQRAELRRKG